MPINLANKITVAQQQEQKSSAIENMFRNAIQSVIDAKAQEKRYDSGVNMALYVNSTVPEWANEAQQFVVWRDNVWNYSYSQLALVLNGQREQPTIEDFLNELPVLNWSETNA